MNLKPVLEGLLFVVGEEGLSLNDICDILDIDSKYAKELIEELKNQK